MQYNFMFVFKKNDRQNHVWSFMTKYHRFLCKFTSWSANETSHVTIHATHSDPWPTLARSSSLFLICCLNIWIYYTIIFCRFTFCFYILMAKQTNRGKRSVFNETHLQKIFFENWRTTKLCEKKERTSEQCPHRL
jgi:hypothetical protein